MKDNVIYVDFTAKHRKKGNLKKLLINILKNIKGLFHTSNKYCDSKVVNYYHKSI